MEFTDLKELKRLLNSSIKEIDFQDRFIESRSSEKDLYASIY